MSRTYRRKSSTEFAEHNKAEYVQPSGWSLWQLKIYGYIGYGKHRCYSVEEGIVANTLNWDVNKLRHHNDKWSGRHKWKQCVKWEARKKRRQEELSELTKVLRIEDYDPQLDKSSLYSDKWHWD